MLRIPRRNPCCPPLVVVFLLILFLSLAAGVSHASSESPPPSSMSSDPATREVDEQSQGGGEEEEVKQDVRREGEDEEESEEALLRLEDGDASGAPRPPAPLDESVLGAKSRAEEEEEEEEEATKDDGGEEDGEEEEEEGSEVIRELASELASHPSLVNEDRRRKFEVTIFSRAYDVKPIDNKKYMLYPITLRGGFPYLCFVPELDDAAENVESVSKETPDSNQPTDAEAESPSTKVEKEERQDDDLNSTPFERAEKSLSIYTNKCFYRLEGWWTYEYCYGKHVRQFHADAQTQKVSAEFALGKYDPDATKETASGKGKFAHFLGLTPLYSDSSNGEKNGVDTSRNSPLSSSLVAGNAASRSSLKGDISPPPIYLIHTGGTVCDLTGKPRETVVAVTCGKQAIITQFSETATCFYRLDVTAPEVCQVQPLKLEEQAEEKIVCVPKNDIPGFE